MRVELPEWVTVREFAAHYRIGLTTAYEHVRANEKALGVVRFGRTIRIPRSALAPAMESRHGFPRHSDASAE